MRYRITSANIRNKLFRIQDSLHGRSVYTQIATLTNHYDHPELIDEYTNHRFRLLLEHAVSTTVFYSKYSTDYLLRDLPMVTKSDYKQHFNDFLSSKYDKSSLVSSCTSGSYGTPFTFYFTRENKASQTAELIYFNRLVGFRVGMKHAHFASRKKSIIEQIKQNQIVIHPAKMDISWCKHTWKILRRSGVKVIVGYPSALLFFGEYLCELKERDRFKPSVIIYIAEPLYHEHQRFLENVYGCPVVGRYAATETGVIACQKKTDPGYFVNTARLIVEIIDPITGKQVAPGERGRVLLTDLYSDAMPLIRYDIGDIATLSDDPANESGVRILDRIEGRAVETIIAPDGSYISPIAIDDVFDGYTGINSFRFIQNTETEFEVELVTHDKYLHEQKLFDGFKRLLGPRANISFKYVDDIPPLPSGKRPFIINEMLRRKAGGV
jgi:phenylacetate-CoA ligase